MYRVILVRKSATYPKESVDPPEDWNFEENPLYKPMTRYLGEHYRPEDVRKLAYHMMQVRADMLYRCEVDTRLAGEPQMRDLNVSAIWEWMLKTFVTRPRKPTTCKYGNGGSMLKIKQPANLTC